MKKISKNNNDYVRLGYSSDQTIVRGASCPMNEQAMGRSSGRKQRREEETISTLYKRALNGVQCPSRLLNVEEMVVAAIRQDKVPLQRKVKAFLSSRRFYVPATAMAAALVLFFVVFSGSPRPVAGPSAMISYVSGEIESVMILETRKTHRTILWFSETGKPLEKEVSVEQGRSTMQVPTAAGYLAS